jgi:hypothetical protein
MVQASEPGIIVVIVSPPRPRTRWRLIFIPPIVPSFGWPLARRGIVRLTLPARLLLQPAFEPLLEAIAGLLKLITEPTGFLLQMIAPAAAAPQKLLAHAGAGQGQVV